MRRSVFVLVCGVFVLVAPLTVGGVSAGAVEPFGTAVTIPPDGPGGVNGSRAAIATDGTVRGFMGLTTTTNRSGPPLRGMDYFRVTLSGQVRKVLSPYNGRVLKVAWDGRDATYVVFVLNSRLYLGKHVESGDRFAPPTYLTSNKGFHGSYTTALTAWAGKWWVVWGENTVNSHLRSARWELFQAHTLLARQTRTRITAPPSAQADDSPALAYQGGTVTLVWTRASRTGGGTSVIRLATSTGAAWHPMTLGNSGLEPAVTMYGGITYVAWTGSEFTVVFAENTGPGHAYRRVVLPGFAGTNGPSDAFPKTVAVSGRTVFIAWTEQGVAATIAERQAGTWTFDQPFGFAAHTFSNDILARGGKARWLHDDNKLSSQP
jgi:hypothetical protein